MNKIKSILILFPILFSAITYAQTAEEILDKVDENMTSENRVADITMIVHGKRKSRTITSKSYAVGDKKSFSEYLSPAREKGIKMLKTGDKLWIYSPSTDRIVQISGHITRQSVMGSDLSYEDMMDDRKLSDVYESKVVGEEELDGRKTKVLQLTAIVSDIAYHSRKVWVDAERYVPLKEELNAKSGELLKRIELFDIKQIEGRWYPTKMLYKDLLKQGKGTEFIITDVKFNQEIPEILFSKASLKQ